MIQSVYKGIEIEIELRRHARGRWKYDYRLIKQPERTMTIHYGGKEFSTMDLAGECALNDARAAIDRAVTP
jgi:hypothetical protein